MKESKAVNVTKRDRFENYYQLYNNTESVKSPVVQSYSPTGFINHTISPVRIRTGTKHVGCQFSGRKDRVICTCGHMVTLKRGRAPGFPEEKCQESRSCTEVGVGSVKALQRRKVKKVYLPETDDRGVGSADLSSYINRRTNAYDGSSYDHKKTSSKCVGGVIEASYLMNQTNTQLKSGTTCHCLLKNNIDIGSNTVKKTLKSTTTQVDNDTAIRNPVKIFEKPIVSEANSTEVDNKANTSKAHNSFEENVNMRNAGNKFSSDSLLQLIHNFEILSKGKTSLVIMENKLEREYRNIFATKSRDEKTSNKKTLSNFKKESALRRRFEALRRSLAKKSNSKQSDIVSCKVLSQPSLTSRRDVSISSDPPSLEAKSYSNVKVYSPKSYYFVQTKEEISRDSKGKKSTLLKKEKPEDDNDSQGVKCMFKLWGKKINLEDDLNKKQSTPRRDLQVPKKAPSPKGKKRYSVKKETNYDKKEGKKFSFFKKKNKGNDKLVLAPKTEVTAGRCDVEYGLRIDELNSRKRSEENKLLEVQYNQEALRKNRVEKDLWSEMDSKKTVKVCWNNKTYNSSSSTVFQLVNVNIYKEADVAWKSRSEIMTSDSSYYKSYTKQVNFVHREIEAWMVPKMIPDNHILPPIKNFEDENMEIRISDQKWIINKSKAFSHTIEVVLNSENVDNVRNDKSTDYLRIDIPQDFFFDSSSGEDKQTQSSDEEVYKIIEYETGETEFKKKETGMETGDHKANSFHIVVSMKESQDIESEIIETVIRRPIHRDVVIQGSDVFIPKRCDVIGVGIITQREMRDIRKPILKIKDDRDTSDEESEHSLIQNTKKCEFAESYLQDYYRNLLPLGLEPYSWCFRDFHLKGSNETSRTSLHKQREGSKSCPNIYDDYQTCTLNEPCNIRGPCHSVQINKSNVSEEKNKDGKGKSSFFKKNKKGKDVRLIRIQAKDSLEVFRRRKIYACSNKSNWGAGWDKTNGGPYSVPNLQDKEGQETPDTLVECPKVKKSCCNVLPSTTAKLKTNKKHVKMPGCQTINDTLIKQMKDPEGILNFKRSTLCDVCKKKSSNSFRDASVGVDEHPPCAESAISCSDLPPCCPSCPSQKRRQQQIQNQVSTCCGSKTCPSKPVTPEKNECAPMKNISNSTSPIKSSTKSSQSSPAVLECPAQKPCRSSKYPTSTAKPSKHKTEKSHHKCSDNTLLKLTPERPTEPIELQNECKPCIKPACLKKEIEKSPICPYCPPCVETQLTQKHSIYSDNSSYSLTMLPCPSRKAENTKNTEDTPVSPKRSPNICSPKPKDCLTSPPRSQMTNQKRIDHNSAETCQTSEQINPCSCLHQIVRPDQKSPKKKKEKKPKEPKRCSTEPCRKPPTPPKPKPHKETNEPESKKEPNQCVTDCGMLTNASVKTVEPKKTKNKKEKECIPDCANRPKPQQSKVCTTPPKSVQDSNLCKIPLPPVQNPSQCQPKPPQLLPTLPQCISTVPAPPKLYSPSACGEQKTTSSKGKLTGLFLKKEPAKKKTCSTDCKAWKEQKLNLIGDQCTTVMDLDNIPTKIKKPASKEEITEWQNINATNDIEKTLYGSINYRKDCAQHDTPVNAVLGDMYKASMNRVSTAIKINNIACEVKKGDLETKSESSSVVNLIEIQIKLKVMQGGKDTEVIIANEDLTDTENTDKYKQVCQATSKVCMHKYDIKQAENINSKNDVNIRILIKNHTSKLNKLENDYKDFSKNIADKFHTVSTAYSSNFAERTGENTFSVHKTTIDLASSSEKSKTNNQEFHSENITDKNSIKFDLTSNNCYKCASQDIRGPTNEKIQIPIVVSTDSKTVTEVFRKEIDRLVDENIDYDDFNASSNSIAMLKKPKNRRERKEMLKLVFEKANESNATTEECKSEYHDMLKVILTSDSSNNEAIAASSNTVTKEVTYGSLNSFYKGSDSMNNLYQIKSPLSYISQDIKFITHPTNENSDSSKTWSESEVRGCLCNIIAEKLNLPSTGEGCCCCSTNKDEETYCDLRNEEDYYLLNYKQYVDIETQHSKYAVSKLNSAHKQNFNNTPVIGQVKTTNKYRQKITKIFVKKSFKKNNINECPVKKFNQNTLLGISDEDKIIMLDTKGARVEKNLAKKYSDDRKLKKNLNLIKFPQTADILQSYETKKAVLAIYAEKIVTDKGERIVAMLPKFDYDKEKVIEKFETIIRNYDNVNNDVVMGVPR